MVTKVETVRGGINQEDGISTYIQLNITNRDLLYSTERSTQYSVIIYVDKKNGYVNMYN